MSDLTLPDDYFAILPSATLEEIRLVKLAREIAMDLHELSHILEVHGVTAADFEKLKRAPYFVRILSAEIAAWQSAVNTQERVKLKTGAMLEELLPTLYARMINPKEDLLKVVKGGELVTKLAGFGVAETKTFDPNDRIQININLGEDTKLQYAQQLPPKVTKTIEHKATFEEILAAADVNN